MESYIFWRNYLKWKIQIRQLLSLLSFMVTKCVQKFGRTTFRFEPFKIRVYPIRLRDSYAKLHHLVPMHRHVSIIAFRLRQRKSVIFYDLAPYWFFFWGITRTYYNPSFWFLFLWKCVRYTNFVYDICCFFF